MYLAVPRARACAELPPGIGQIVKKWLCFCDVLDLLTLVVIQILRYYQFIIFVH